MAGVCEGGNEPSGSLKAICNRVWLPRECTRASSGKESSGRGGEDRASVHALPAAGRGEGKLRSRHGAERETEVKKHLEADCYGFQRLRDAEHSRL
ncbi:hypothetical protein ANN_05000 [Periplaneta americana]|uniref:Uncharacterized protein n=1 Tax=Periplaneta americana TaxID=6978 RepID=A0ABQ8TBR6_PERAM|nr:hypothetical protein ANN_05000 [Periplaneta americana]